MIIQRAPGYACGLPPTVCSSEQTGLAPVVDAISASCSVWGTLGTSVADLGLLPRPFQVQGRVCDALWLPGGLQELPGKRLESQNLQAGIAEQGELDNEQNGYFGKCRGVHTHPHQAQASFCPARKASYSSPKANSNVHSTMELHVRQEEQLQGGVLSSMRTELDVDVWRKDPQNQQQLERVARPTKNPEAKVEEQISCERAKQKEARANNKTKVTVEAMVEHHGDSRPLSWKPWVSLCRMSRHRNPQ